MTRFVPWNGPMLRCTICGALVADTDDLFHAECHERQAKLLNEIASRVERIARHLTQIIRRRNADHKNRSN